MPPSDWFCIGGSLAEGQPLFGSGTGKYVVWL